MFSFWERRRSSVFHPKERAIYHYFDGEKMVRADPMVLYKKIMQVGPELSIDIQVAKSPSKDALEADNEVLRKMRDIFSLKSFEEGGLSEKEVIDLFDHFWDYLDGVKKNSSPSSISSTLDSSTSSPGASPTLNSSSSGSCANGSSTAEQELSPTAQASP